MSKVNNSSLSCMIDGCTKDGTPLREVITIRKGMKSKENQIDMYENCK